MDYGSDIRLDDDRDIAIDGDDLAVIDGPALVAQDVREEIDTPLGSLFWDRSAGSHLRKWLLAASASPPGVTEELERVALRDPRVDAETVHAEQRPDGSYRLRFRVLGHVPEQVLRFDLQELARV